MVVKTDMNSHFEKLKEYIEEKSFKGYDPFDGLESPLVKYLTLNNKYLRIVWIQFFKKSLINFRPFVGIKKNAFSKAIGDITSTYFMLYSLYKDKSYLDKAMHCLQWLEENSCRGYSGHCWGLGFDYQNRGIYVRNDVPNIVTTYFNANAILDAFEVLKNSKYLEIAKSSCDFILKDLGFSEDKNTLCINYYPIQQDQIHDANMLGVALLSRVYKHTKKKELLRIADKAVRYTMKLQREDGSWYYSEKPSLRWIDNFHTGYILESLFYYINNTATSEFMPNLLKGLEFYLTNLFLSDGTPKYYNNRIYPIDIQSAAQAIQTFAVLSNLDRKYLDMSKKIAKWTIENMQDESGYFYYRKYRFFMNKISYIRWGGSSMLIALAHLMKAKSLQSSRNSTK